MKAMYIASSIALTALLALTGCAGNKNTSTRSLGQAEATMTLANDSKLDAATTASAAAKLDSAKALQADGEEEQAQALAEQADLEVRLALATAERDQVKKENEKVENELRADVERKLIYQSILDKETKKEGK
ncbi:DUF4398 domain-containing protein [Fibrobacter sp. UWEL]|uniref:DUF4398 domain-containing protein n=1 Tax=Fibrobacter sp. UWEL TaxID=1896209 RepID=UPI00091BB6CB|nr:DUF4398 domain-containing protein [Fibrobacter sp. UWEL]SHK33573.1 protein of unknown function [Fibrobacter sp. UWEL]